MNTVKHQIETLEQEKKELFKNGYTLSKQDSQRNREIVKELISLYEELFDIQMGRWAAGLSLTRVKSNTDVP
jgi:hypothetical protein